ncbi:MAG: PAS domain-containing protein [Deltaproteobacteria bacterium]|nr:PAS domain-containing protein [Deltaproteobacteria bacterium]MBW1872251.1 PAS domain-containing protein [Deltaproteobacteria bacterium]
MLGTTTNLDDFLENVLRGAAKILGCNSTNLVVINEKTRNMQVRIGITAGDFNKLAELEEVMGNSFRGLSASIDNATDSLLYKVWRDGSIAETSRLHELVGGAIPAEVIEQFEKMVGDHRFILVPAAGAHRHYGVLLFEKLGVQPFSRQQREVMLHYARRIGDIIENDLKGHGQVAIQPPSDPGEASLEYQLLQLTLGDPAPAVFVDQEFNVTSCNEAFVSLTGKLADELSGSSIGELFREPDKISRLLNQQILSPGTAVHEKSAVIFQAGGSISAVRVEALLLADEQERVVGFLILLHAEEKNKRWSTERLIQQERLATMGEMAAQLAHEIRNPLVAIGATLESLGRELVEDKHQRLLASAVREITRMDMVLKKYLSPRQDMVFLPVKLSQLFGDVKHLLAGVRSQTDKRISVEVDPDLSVLGDYDGLKHVIFNLILNAFEASGPGEEVVCRADLGDRDVSIFIEDRGPGLTVSADKCFQPFFTIKKNGTGLGLPVCRKIVQAHGGLIDLQGRAGGGCRAVVILPRQLTANGNTGNGAGL